MIRMGFREKHASGFYRGVSYFAQNRITRKGQRIPGGNQPRRAMARVFPGAPRPAADSVCRRRRSGYRSWGVLGGWRSPEAPRRQQRRGYRDRTSERSRDLVGAHVGCEAKKDENLDLRRPCVFLRRRGLSTLC